MRVRLEATGEALNLDATPLGRGGEAAIHALTDTATAVAKIYHQPTAEHAAKLGAMLAAPPADPMAGTGHVSIAWPSTRLFDADSRCIGYLMPRVHEARLLHEFYNPKVRQQVCPGFHHGYLLRTARNLAAAVRAVHERGYVIGDVNESNILVTTTALVALIDTDSFQVRASDQVFRCRVGKPEYTPPELQRARFAEVDRGPEHDAFGLAVLIFQLLMQGAHPFLGVFTGQGEPASIPRRIEAGHWPYATSRTVPYKPTPLAPPFAVLPAPVRDLMQRCFDDGHTNPASRPGAREWQQALHAAEKELITCPDNPQHCYHGRLSTCPWCDLAQIHGRDPFPTPGLPGRATVSRPAPAPRRTLAAMDVPTAVPVGAAIPKPRREQRRQRMLWPWVAAIGGLLVLGAGAGVYYQRNAARAARAVTTGSAPGPDLVAQAEGHRQRGDTERAIRDATEAIKRTPRLARAYGVRGAAHADKNDLDSALRDLDEAIRLDPKDAEAYAARGKVQGAKRDHDRAVADLTQAIQLGVKTASIYFLRAEYQRIRGDFAAAVADYTEVLRLDPKNSAALGGRGAARAERGEYELAVADLTEAFAINPRYTFALCYRADIHRVRGEHERAIADCTEAIKIDASLAWAWGTRGLGHLSKRELDRAIPDLTEALRLNPRYAIARRARGIAYRLRTDYDRAIADLTEAIQLNGRDGDAYFQRGESYRMKGDYDQAIADCSEAIKIDPKNSRAWGTRGAARRHKGSFAAAAADLTEALRLDPDYGWARMQLALARSGQR
ncbi:MAG: tetratricopeptide repeat protein [Gemmataceae bacterium]|nr:tetratricopeptide repeat protein [Gemmataceae bacterium]